ncbi:MAG: hypothetical protein QM582_12895 [Micropruina sp.]|uniref:hypothetical protein n=1 Tax=Micropruina sp. TaxID=2737536 RepID=UPI0039E2F742
MTALQAPKHSPSPRRPEERATRWGLREVRLPQRTMASVPFVLSLGVLLALGMVGLLLLNTALQEQAFAVRDQQKVATQLGYRLSALETEVTEARSTTRLAIEAGKLGMVPNPYPVYLPLPGGDVIGDPTAINGSELPDVRYRTPEELAKIAKARDEAMAKAAAEQKKAAAEAKAKAAEAKKAAEEAKKKAAEAKKAAEQKKADAAKAKAKADAAKAKAKKNGTGR